MEGKINYFDFLSRVNSAFKVSNFFFFLILAKILSRRNSMPWTNLWWRRRPILFYIRWKTEENYLYSLKVGLFLCFFVIFFNSYSSTFGGVVNLCNGKDEGILSCFLAYFSHDHDHSNSLACWGHAGKGGDQSGGFNTKNIGLYSHFSFFLFLFILPTTR